MSEVTVGPCSCGGVGAHKDWCRLSLASQATERAEVNEQWQVDDYRSLLVKGDDYIKLSKPNEIANYLNALEEQLQDAAGERDARPALNICEGIPQFALESLEPGDLALIVDAAKCIFNEMHGASGLEILNRMRRVYEPLNRLGNWCLNCKAEVTKTNGDGLCDECQDEAVHVDS